MIAVFLFDDRLEFLGDSVGYRDFVVGDWLRLRTKLASITDKPFLPVLDTVKEESFRRTDTFELSSTVELFLPAYNDDYKSEIDLT